MYLEDFVPAIVAIAILAVIVALLAAGYVKAPPDMAFIISGIKKKLMQNCRNFILPYRPKHDIMGNALYLFSFCCAHLHYRCNYIHKGGFPCRKIRWALCL